MLLEKLTKFFSPRESKFFAHLEKIADCAGGAAELFGRLRDARERDEFRRLAEQLLLKEHDADELAHRLYEELDKTIVNRVDREDLYALAHGLDDVVDSMEAAADRICLLKLSHLTEPMRELVRIEREAALAVVASVKRMKSAGQAEAIRLHIIQVNSLENEADRIYRGALAGLLDNTTNPIELIRQKEILDSLEKAIDACEHVADAIRTVVIKNS